MVLVQYHNKEIEALIAHGKSSLYRKVSNKRSFVKSLRAFVHLLKVLRTISDLEKFHHLQYKKGVEYSSVIIEEKNLEGLLIFYEQNSGQTITITELICTKQQGL